MTPDRFEVLSKRQRECLRGVARLKASGEIATDLDLSTSTVNGYVAEAVKLLGTRDRRAAALAFAQYEREHPEKHRGEYLRVAPEPSADPPPPSPDPVVKAPAAGVRWRPRLPVRRDGRSGNDLGVAERLLWIPAITVAIAIAFGMLMTGLQITATLIERMWRAFG